MTHRQITHHIYNVENSDMKKGIILKLFGTRMSQIICVQNQ